MRVADTNKYVYDVETAEFDTDEVLLNGWLFRAKAVRNKEVEPLENFDYCLVLVEANELENKDNNGNIKGIVASMSRIVREDVNSYFKCEYDYSDCGFIASFDKKTLNEETVYQVFIKILDAQNRAIATNVYLYNKRIYRVNPKLLSTLDVTGTDLESLVNNGVVVVARPDFGFYVVQSDKKLYWIADESAFFEEDGSTIMQYQMDTTQFLKLPQKRLENDWYWSNLGESFESNEITDSMNCGKYRVMVRDIPMDYSITHMYLGYHDGENWIWKDEIKPVYKGELIP